MIARVLAKADDGWKSAHDRVEHPPREQIPGGLSIAMVSRSIASVHLACRARRRISWHGIASSMFALVVYDFCLAGIVFKIKKVINGAGKYLDPSAKSFYQLVAIIFAQP